MVLKINHLSFAFTDKPVLHDISFEANAGDMLAILGPNGAGKTTLIRLLTGIMHPDKGTISIDGNNTPYTFTSKQKRMIGIMYPIKGVYLKMTGYEYLSLIGAFFGMESNAIKERIDRLSHDLLFSNELHREIKKYSTGTKKKIEFCAAMIANPKLLFLDEPFESVDPKVSYEIKMYIKSYSNSGGTLIITSHILDTIQNLCTRYMILNNGQIVYSDTMRESVELEKKYMEVIGYE